MSHDKARARMIETQLAARGVHDARVLAAMAEVPREAFVGEGLEDSAYQDNPLPIGEGQTISQPFIVATMAQAAQLQPEDRVLEIGAGSGYAAAVLSRLARHVFAIERLDGLSRKARAHWQSQGYGNITLKTGDGSLGWPEEAPFDAILVAAGVPSLPDALSHQLTIGGRLIVPVGGPSEQRLLRIRRRGADAFQQEDLGGVRFVPLIGAQGWQV